MVHKMPFLCASQIELLLRLKKDEKQATWADTLTTSTTKRNSVNTMYRPALIEVILIWYILVIGSQFKILKHIAPEETA